MPIYLSRHSLRWQEEQKSKSKDGETGSTQRGIADEGRVQLQRDERRSDFQYYRYSAPISRAYDIDTR